MKKPNEMGKLKAQLKKEFGFTYANVLIRNSKGSLAALKAIIITNIGIEYAKYIFRIAKLS